MCYFSIKSGEGGRAKSGSKAFGELLCSQPKAKILDKNVLTLTLRQQNWINPDKHAWNLVPGLFQLLHGERLRIVFVVGRAPTLKGTGCQMIFFYFF
jgi:hypothetical protein